MARDMGRDVEPTRAGVAQIMEAVRVARPSSWTKVSFVADLTAGTVDVYYFHQFRRPITLRVDEELATRRGEVPLSSLFPDETRARADAEYERLTAVARKARTTAIVWTVLACAFVLLAWLVPSADSRSRRSWALTVLALGPLGLAAWLASRRGRHETAGPTPRGILSQAVPWAAAGVAGTVAATAATIGFSLATRSPAWQLAAFYALPIVVGWPASKGVLRGRGACGPSLPTPGQRVLLTVVCGHLALAGIWVAVMTMLRRILWTTGPGVTPVALSWAVAALGAALGTALVGVFLALSPRPAWRRSWWWIPLSVLVLLVGAFLGSAFSRLLDALPLLATLLAR
jgi:hypothetical protein